MESVENSSDAIGISTPEGRHYYQNRAFDDLFGSVGENPPESVYADAAMGRDVFRTIMAGGSWSGEVRMYGRDRRELVIYLRAYASKDARGRITALVGVHTDITGRTKADAQREEALARLRESERRMSAIVDGSPIPQFVLDGDHRIVHWNRALAEYSGIPPEEVVGTRQQWRAFYRSERPCLADLVLDGAVDQLPRWYEGKFSPSRLIEQAYEATDFFPEMKGGIWLHFTAAPVRDAAGKVIGAVETLADVTELMRVEKDLVASHNQQIRHALLLEALLAAMPIPVFYKDAEGRYLGCNDLFSEIMGVTPEDIRGKTVFDLWPHDLAEGYHLNDQELFRAPGTRDYEYRIKTGSGEIRDVIFRKSVFLNEEGGTGGIVGAYFDITERKRAEEELKFSNLILNTQMETSIDGILVVSEDGRILLHNSRFASMWGIPAEVLAQRSDELALKVALDCVANPDAFLEKVDAIYHRHDQCSFDQVNLKDGRIFERYSAPITATDGAYRGRVWYFRDSTGRTIAERALRESEEKYRDLAEMLPQAVFECDLQGRVTYANRRALHDFGYTPEDLERGVYAPDLVVDSDRPRLRENARAILKGAASDGEEYRILRKDGSSFEALSYSTLIQREGAVTGLRGIMIDISDLKRAQREHVQIQGQLIHAQKMNAIGTLSSGIAHDFNNMLGGIVGSLSLLELLLGKETLEQRDAILEYVATAMEASGRATDLVRQLLTISRKDEILTVPVDLMVSLRHVQNICRNSLPKSVELDFELPGAPCRVLADPTRIEQVFLNMCVNASHSMTIMRAGEKQGGILHVSIGMMTADAHFAALHPEAERDRAYFKVSIRDTGVGMDEETQARIFEPFFSTKSREEGTGLGLSVAYGIIHQIGGFIRVYSEKGHGSVFWIYLPALARAERTAVSTESRASELPHPACVLLIDDEQAILRVAEGILGAYGCTVYSALSGENGISLFRKHRQEINMVILDISLPGMSGFEIFDALRAIDPSARVVLCSGFAEDERIRAAIAAGAAGFLQKPYTTSSLLEAVRSHARR